MSALHRPAAAAPAGPPPTKFSMSAGLLRRLASIGCSIAFTSYQSGLLYMLGRDPAGGARLHQSAMPKPMGLGYDPEHGLLLAGGFQIMQLRNVLAADERVNGKFDACFVPRQIHVTGQLDAHDIIRCNDGQPVFVNTRFNCLATIDPLHSFRPVWQPPFISALVDEDRCHLNGLAADAAGNPAYATAVSRSDTIDGWRDRRGDGGVLIDVAGDHVVLDGLSMPHSPRLHRGELWLLNSGTGELGVVTGLDGPDARFEPRAFCPGFLRGLAFHENLAFVGLSKPRYKRFEGLALDRRLREADSEPWCGVQIIDTATGQCVDWLRIDGAVAELYDVAVLPGIACPMTVSPGSPQLASLVTYAGRGALPAAAIKDEAPDADADAPAPNAALDNA